MIAGETTKGEDRERVVMGLRRLWGLLEKIYCSTNALQPSLNLLPLKLEFRLESDFTSGF